MDAIETAQAFVDEMRRSLESVETDRLDAREYVDTLIRELGAAKLARNPRPVGERAPRADWDGAVAFARRQRPGPLLDTIVALQPCFPWIRSKRFWPEEKHRSFSMSMTGAILIGQEDAAFTAEDRYIALVASIDPETTYPLHQHRIEELYYVVSGHAEWSHDGARWVTLPPGGVFFNGPHEPHSIRTNSEPLIFVSFYLPPFGWEGGMVDQHE